MDAPRTPDAGPPPVEEILTDGVAAPATPASSWRDVILTPLRGGSVLGFAGATAAFAWMSWLEGGAGDEAMPLLLRPLLLILALVILAVYAHRIVLCTIEGDRPVPWLSDLADPSGVMQDVGSFAAILVMALWPGLLLSVLVGFLGGGAWAQGFIALCCLVVASLHIPFALASSVLRQGALGASYGVSRRAWKANRDAAKTALAPTAAFLGLLALSFVVAQVWVPHFDDANPKFDHTAGRDAARAAVMVLRAAAVWAAFAAFRVSGMLARDVPEIREVLQ
ncbi:MAG: hypothetical protein K8T90_12295 [Planctomycetes bacterium]|nr:hypothetical protein [Planctomycetota bacterium]